MFLGVANTNVFPSKFQFQLLHVRRYSLQTMLFTVPHKYLLNIFLMDYNYFGSMTTNDEKCIREIKSRIFMAKATLHKKKNLFTSKLYLNLRKKWVK